MPDNLGYTAGEGSSIAADDIAGVYHQRIKVTLGSDGVSDGDVSAANPMPTTATATDALLTTINGKLPTASVTMPASTDASLPVRQLPQQYWDWSFAKVYANAIDTTKGTLIRTGSGHTVNQTGGNLVITAGTTANAETVIRTLDSWSGALTFWESTTLSQRIVNNNFYLELVDVIGDSLAYNIVNTTTVDVTKNGHGFTAINVGQRMDLCALSSVGVPMEGVIASIPDANTIRFTVSGYPASGSGTLSLTGWNKIELNYTGTSATAVAFNTRRQGYQNTAVSSTINTSASGHIAAVNVTGGVASLADQVLTSAGVLANRSAWKLNVPEQGIELYLQIRAKNGTTNPASGTTWTIGMVRVEDYIAQQVEITNTRQQSIGNSLPVNVIGTVPVSGTVTATVTGGTVLPVTPTTSFTNSAASTNATVTKGSAGTVWSIIASNINAAVRYLKVYNKATAPTVGSDTPVLVIPIPAGGTVQFDGGSNGIRFATGIGWALTTGAADSDSTGVAASEHKIAMTYT